MTAPKRVIAEVFGEGHEFWKQDTKRTYTAAAIFLLSKGCTEEEAADILGSLYGAACEEYGA